MKTVNIFWFRRDLRLDDNVGLYKALHGRHAVLPIFIFDTEILESLPKDDARVTFIFDQLQELRKQLQKKGSSLAIYYGKPKHIFEELLSKYTIGNVVTNRDYEPYATERDTEVAEFLKGHGVGFFTFKDQVIFEKNEITKADGTPYVVYTPYMKKWKEKFRTNYNLKHYRIDDCFGQFIQHTKLPQLCLADMGFTRSGIQVPPYRVTSEMVNQYERTRNFPSKDGTSRLGPHLRFGTVSVRKTIKQATQSGNEIFWQELIWREFFMQVLWHFPKTHKQAFKSKYDRIEWRNNEDEFEKWKTGQTGYPMVDAGMRELNTTGYMHNRVRMVVASFLSKHLLIDWRWGEAYFAEKLLDYDMASNVGNWQWAAGSGVDAAPYFRVFNPTTQMEKFDKNLTYIKKWIPEHGTNSYPDPIVNHKQARERCLEVYQRAVR